MLDAFMRHRDLAAWAALLAGIVVIAALHHLTDPVQVVRHEVYNYLGYVPIILAAYRYGVAGGLATAVLMSAALIPHIRSVWADNPAYTASQWGQILAFHLIGVTVGLLAGAQRRSTARYRDAAESLERAHRDLVASHEQLRRADQLSALGEIAAGLAHEIQNPVAGIKGAIEIVASRVASGTPEAEFVGVAAKELLRVEGLVTEFLDYARPHDPALSPGDLHSLVRHVTAMLHPEADRKRVPLVVESDAIIPVIELDPQQITQVLVNVILNAIQASEDGTPVRIREAVESGWVVLDVIDLGPGIPSGHLARLFDPFFTTKPRGTGLGLAISQRILTAHRGTIETMPGSPRGTVFRIRLPIR